MSYFGIPSAGKKVATVTLVRNLLVDGIIDYNLLEANIFGFEIATRKDDLADRLLQALFYFCTNIDQ